MEQISGMASGAAHLPSAAAGAREPPKVQRPEEKAQSRPPEPAADEYVPEEKREPWGRYWVVRDEDGRSKVCFDGPEGTGDAPGGRDGVPGAGAPEQGGRTEGPEKKAAGRKSEHCTGDTGQVDREIEKLKKRRAELERRLSAETDEAKLRDLEKELAQVESELRRKDNDAYRRRHTTFS